MQNIDTTDKQNNIIDLDQQDKEKRDHFEKIRKVSLRRLLRNKSSLISQDPVKNNFNSLTSSNLLKYSQQTKLSSRMSISEQTQLTNQQIQKYLQIVEVSGQKNQYNDYESEKQNAGDIIQTSKQQIKQMHQSLRNIVVAARYHKELLPGRPLLIDLIEDQPSFCKLIPHDSKSPAVFKIELQGEMAKKKKPEFKIYISTKVKEPTHNNHEKFVDSELRFMFKKGKIGDEFKFNTKIYLTILSKQAGSIILTVLFPHDNISQNDNNQKKQIPLRIKQKQLDENGQEIEVEYIRDIKSIEESFDRILKKEDAKRGLDSFKDYVGKNKSIMRQWSRTKLHNEFESRIRKIEYQQLAVSKRQMIDEAKRERVQYLLNKKDIMLAQKEKILQAKREYLIKMQRNTKFVKLMRAKQVIKEIFIQFDLQQKKNRNYWDRYRCSKIIGKSFRKRETRKGINFSVRTARMTAMSLIFFAQTQSDIQRNKAKEIIKQILIDHEASRRLKTSFFDFYRKKKLLITGVLLHYKKNTRKTKALIRRLNEMSEKVKNQVIKIYFYFCKDTYIVKYLNWRIQKLKFQNKPIEFNWLIEIEQMQQNIKSRESLLFDNLNQFAEQIIFRPQNQQNKDYSRSPSPQISPKRQKSSSPDNIRKYSTSNYSLKLTNQNSLQHQKSQQDDRANEQQQVQGLIRLKTMMIKKQSTNKFGQAIDQDNEDIEEVVIRDPGPPPIFIFMPSKEQLQKMIIKAIDFQKEYEKNLKSLIN
eukprot:403355613